MGAMGLTEIQQAKFDELYKRKYDPSAKPLTNNMELELSKLHYQLSNPTLPATATTFLREWYANDYEPVFSRYTDKGNYVESDLIDFMAVQLGFGLAQKNTDPPREDEYFIGTCDVETPNLIVDVKAPWNRTTLQQNVDKIDPDYEWQLRGYMRLWDKQEAILFYGLMDTPPEVNFEREVIYSDMKDSDRWIGYKITRDLELEQSIIDRVKLCRTWLDGYDKLVKNKIGKLHLI